MAARRRMLTTSKGSTKPCSVVLSICLPILFTSVDTGVPDEAENVCSPKKFRVSNNPRMTASAAKNALEILGLGIDDPEAWVRKMEKMISTTMPPTYTTI